MRLYEDYRLGAITKDRYRMEHEKADVRIIEIEKMVSELKEEDAQIREWLLYVEEW